MIKYSPECTETHYFQMKDQKIFWGGGTAPFPDPSKVGRGTPPSHTPPPSAPAAPRVGDPPMFFFTNRTLCVGIYCDSKNSGPSALDDSANTKQPVFAETTHQLKHHVLTADQQLHVVDQMPCITWHINNVKAMFCDNFT